MGWCRTGRKTRSWHDKPTLRNASQRGQFCIVPAASIFEPCYETGKALRHEVTEQTAEPLGVAGIWKYRSDGDNGLPLLSFSMLTINADDHALMARMHRPEDEKRMLVFLEPGEYDDWLNCRVEDAPGFFRQFPAARLKDAPAPKPAKATTQASLPDL